jgi:integrase
MKARGPKLKGKGPETLYYNVQALMPFWGSKTPDDVTELTCIEYELERAKPRPRRLRNGKIGKKPVSAGPEKVRRELGTLQSALIWAVRNGIITHARDVTLPAAGKQRERYLERWEVAWILMASAPHLRRFILISLASGRREKAVLDLKWKRGPGGGWMDLRSGVMHFLEPEGQESDKKRGACRMTRKLLSHARRWRRMADGEFVINWDRTFDTDWLDRRNGSEEPVDSKLAARRAERDAKREEEREGRRVARIYKAFVEACRRAEKLHKDWVKRTGADVEPLDLSDVSPHTLKHTAITWYYIAGGDTDAAVEFFNTSARTLQRYRKHSPKHQARAQAVVERGGRPPAEMPA